MEEKAKDIKKDTEKKTGITGRKKLEQSCESCEFYDYDDESDSYVCMMDLDQDEMANFIGGNTRNCHYYRYYDEYKSVNKQI